MANVSSTNNEQWLPVADHPGYEVSSFGRVRSVDRWIVRSDGVRRFHLGKVLKLWLTQNKYYQITLSGRRYKVHRIVARAFIPNPKSSPYINHIDHDGTNNHVSNLEWCTQKENMQHASKHGRFPKTKPGLVGKNHFASIAVEQHTIEGIFVTVHESGHLAAKAVGSRNSAHINDCCHGRRATAYGFRWCFRGNHIDTTRRESYKPRGVLQFKGDLLFAKYKSISEAAKASGFSVASISHWCHGRRNCRQGYTFIFDPSLMTCCQSSGQH